MFTWKKYVYEIYKEKSFSKAAQNLYISQPSLSARIKKIEQQIGAPIFDRSTTPLRMTEVGEAYISASEKIFQIEQDMENYINDLNTLKSGSITIGASNLFAAYILPPIITKFKQCFPDINIRLTEGNTTQLEELLCNNTLDMVFDNNHYDNILYDKGLYNEEAILLAVPGSFSVNEEVKEYQLTPQDLQNKTYFSPECPVVPLAAFSQIPFIMLTPGNDTRIRGDKLCREAGFQPDIVLEFNQQATAYMAATTQMGATFSSDILVSRQPSFDNLVYYKLEGEAARRKVYFYYKKHKFKTRAMEEFIRMMQENGEG